MKRYFFVGLFILLLFPCMVNAKEYCKVVSGDGKSVGTELKCGTEHFYIVENENNTIRMLAKYNLLVGDKIDNIVIDINDYNDSGLSQTDYCMQVGENSGYHPYYVYFMINNDNYSCRIYEKIEYTSVRQDERAVGTKLVNGKSILPLYGIVYMNRIWGYDYMHDNIVYENNYDDNGNIILNGSVFEKYINGYKNELEGQNIVVDNVSLLTINEVIKLLKDISGQDVNIDLEYPSLSDYQGNEPFYGKMDIKNYIGNNKWIHDATYWLGSGFYGDPSNPNEDYHNDYYISNEGMLCAIGRGECQYFPYPIGNGVRPLVSISGDNIQYLIKTVTDGHGSIEVVDYAAGGDSIKFKIKSNKGYKLSSISITTDSGETINFDAEVIQKNSSNPQMKYSVVPMNKSNIQMKNDENNNASIVQMKDDDTYQIDRNVFTMPFENVTIQAKWKLDVLNPNTGTIIIGCFIVINLIILCLFTIVFLNKCKKSS